MAGGGAGGLVFIVFLGAIHGGDSEDLQMDTGQTVERYKAF